MRFLAVVLIVITQASVALAQNPGQRVHVTVRVSSVVTRGDTAGVGAVVTSLASSTEELWRYNVDAPGGVLTIRRPAPDSDWNTSKIFRDRPMAHWAILKSFPPGSSTPELYFEALGLPGIVTYWAGGDFVHPSTEGEDLPDSVPTIDPLVGQMISGKTVGVEPWPADRSAKGLLARLRSLTQTSCATPLLWITSSTLCTKLVGYLNQAEASRAGGKTTQAKSALNNFISSLSGRTAGTFATGVTSSGYWLLKPNASVVITKL